MRVVNKIFESRLLFFVSAIFVLFLSFSFNIFGVGVNDSWFTSFEQGSELIIKKTAQCKNDQSFYSGPLIYRNYKDGVPANPETCSITDLTPYSSQFGLQARAIAMLAPNDDAKLDRYFKLVELSLALVSATLLALLATKIFRQYGTVTAGVVVILISISPWVIGYAGNMYWVLPLFLAPFVLTYTLYDRMKERKHYYVFYSLIILLFTLKLLDGYEHITTMAASVFAVIAFYELRSIKNLFKQLVYPALCVGGSVVIAFVIALAIHVTSINEYYDDIGRSLQVVGQRAEARSGAVSSIIDIQYSTIYSLQATLPEVYSAIDYYHSLELMKDGKSNPILYFLISAMNYALLPAVDIPFEIKGIFGVLLQSILFIGALGYLAAIKIKDKTRIKLIVATTIGLLGALSWLILMPAHAYPHSFLNGIIFYVPFLIFVYIIIGVWVSENLSRSKKRRVKK